MKEVGKSGKLTRMNWTIQVIIDVVIQFDASPPGMYQAGHSMNKINFNQWNKIAYWITGAGVLQHQWNFLVWVKVVHTVEYIAPQIV